MSKKSLEEIREQLRAIHQEQLLRYYDELDPSGQNALLKQIGEIDFSYLSRFHEKDVPVKRGVITPLRAMELPEIEKKRTHFYEIGMDALKKQETGAVLLAGGMGTRLGFDGPKGCFDIGVTRHVYIFERLITNLLRRVKECGKYQWFFIMTSDANDEETRSFFRTHDCFGYDPAYIRFFKQAMAPAVDEDGQVLLSSKSAVATSPNGNGGWYRSMGRAGLTDLMNTNGVRYLNVFSVDNVLQDICDPLFIGAVIDGGYASGSKVVRKNDPFEKTGVMCLEDGRTSVIEYTEMTEEMCLETDSRGERVYNFGVILNYLFRVDSLAACGDALMPLHFAHKKVPYIGSSGELITPGEPNGWKFEYFIFDILKSLRDCLPFEVEREKSFAPVKNRTGVDSVETARALCRMNGIEL